MCNPSAEENYVLRLGGELGFGSFGDARLSVAGILETLGHQAVCHAHMSWSGMRYCYNPTRQSSFFSWGGGSNSYGAR